MPFGHYFPRAIIFSRKLFELIPISISHMFFRVFHFPIGTEYHIFANLFTFSNS